jgi:hypothetical protein
MFTDMQVCDLHAGASSDSNVRRHANVHFTC